MSIDYTALKSEIQTDPLGLGYGSYVANGNDIAVANILNNKNGPGSSGIIISSMPRDQFMLSILPAISSIGSGSATIKDKWDRILKLITSANMIDNTSAIQFLLGQSVQDGLWTQPQASAVFVRNGSRAEVLFGENTVLTHIDIGTAIRGS